MLRKFVVLIALTMLPVQAFALSLEEAKSKGWVGERMDGYIGPVVETPEVITLVKDINNQRRAQYQSVASQRGQSVEVVQKIGAQTAYDKTPGGYYIQNAQGAWVKK